MQNTLRIRAVVESMGPALGRAMLLVMLAVGLTLPSAVAAWGAVRQQSNDEAEIRAVLEHYLQGHATGRALHFEAAFHPDGELLWVADGALRTRSAEDYIAGASGTPADDEDRRTRRIAWIDVAGDMAVARVELDYPGVFFVDYMTLARVEGSWRIVAKGFQLDRSGALRAEAAATPGRDGPSMPAGPPQEAGAPARIAERGAAFSRAYVAGDSAAIRDLYTDGALLLPPGGRVEGVDRVVRYFRPGPSRENLSHAMESERLEVLDSVAVDVGTWSNTWRVDDGPVREASDRYLIVWRRGDDGQWRIAYDMWHRPAG